MLTKKNEFIVRLYTNHEDKNNTNVQDLSPISRKLRFWMSHLVFQVFLCIGFVSIKKVINYNNVWIRILTTKWRVCVSYKPNVKCNGNTIFYTNNWCMREFWLKFFIYSIIEKKGSGYLYLDVLASAFTKRKWYFDL